MIGPVVQAVRRVAVFALKLPILVYRYTLSPMLGPRCRFTPSCSEYALQAIERHGPFTGSGLAVWRLCRCHPFNEGGPDPVPPAPLRLTVGGGRWPAAMRPGSTADKD